MNIYEILEALKEVFLNDKDKNTEFVKFSKGFSLFIKNLRISVALDENNFTIYVNHCEVINLTNIPKVECLRLSNVINEFMMVNEEKCKQAFMELIQGANTEDDDLKTEE